MSNNTWNLSLLKLPVMGAWYDTFLQAEGHSPDEIHCHLCCVYGKNVVSDSAVKDWWMIGLSAVKWLVKGAYKCTWWGRRGQLLLVNLFKKSNKLYVIKVVSQFVIFQVDFDKCWGQLFMDLLQTSGVSTSSMQGGFQNIWLTFKNSDIGYGLGVPWILQNRGG